MAKKIKLQIPAGKATAAPPVGTALGPTGINIGDFVKRFNEATREKTGDIIPVIIQIHDDRTFSFEMKLPPMSRLLLKKMGKEKGSGKNRVSRAGSLTEDEVRAVAEEKMEDLNARDIKAAMNIAKGTARSMGIEIKE